MLRKHKKETFCPKLDIYEIKWYPNNTGFLGNGTRRIKPRQMPPLMVRKAEWRR